MRILIVIILLAFPSQIFAALINTYWLDSETELEYLFETNQIDLEQYLLLDELFSLPLNFDSLTAADFILDTDDADSLIRELNSHESIGPDKLNLNFTYRYYQDFDQSRSNHEYLYLNGEYDYAFNFDFQCEKSKDQRDIYFRQRRLSFNLNNLEIDLGNYIPRWGEGITIGHYNRFLDKDSNPLYNSVLYPRLGRYNGIHLAYKTEKLSSEVIVTHDRTAAQSGTAAAFNLAYLFNQNRIGLIGNHHRIKNDTIDSEYENSVFGIFGKYCYDRYGFKAEISEYKGKFFAYYMQITRNHTSGRFRIAVWNYPSSYINPYGAGRANSDYTTIEIEDTEIEYRSRQNGEYGLLLSSSMILFPRLQLSTDINYWRDSGIEEKLRSKWMVGYNLSGPLDVRFTYLWGDDNLSDSYGRRDHYRIDLIWRSFHNQYIRVGSEFKRIYYDYGRRDYFRVELKVRWQMSEDVGTSFKLNRIDSDISDTESGYWLLYLSEELSLSSNIFLKATLDSREGKTYNLIDSSRLKLTLEFIS